jgi:hypothetical protein
MIVVHVINATGTVRMKSGPSVMMTAAKMTATMMAATMMAAVCACQLCAHKSDHECSCQNQ